MSIEVTKLVRKAPLDKGHKSLLLAMADYASADGRDVFPGTARLARDTGYTPRWISKLRGDLIAMGLLIVTRPSTPVWPGRYRIDLDLVSRVTEGGVLSSPAAVDSPPEEGHSPPVNSVPGPPEVSSPKPSMEPSVEPSHDVSGRLDQEVERALQQAIDRGTKIKNLDRYRQTIRENIKPRFEAEEQKAVETNATIAEIDACRLCNEGGLAVWEIASGTPMGERCTHNQSDYAGLDLITR